MYNYNILISGGLYMKRLKKVIASLLVMLIAVPFAAAFGAQAEGYLTIQSSGSYAVVKKCETRASGAIDIPAEYAGVPVTQIAQSAFSGCNMITQVNIPASVTSVGSNAFDGCTMLKTVNFAGEDCTVGLAAFRYCTVLESISLPARLAEIPAEMFSYCTSLSDVSIPSTVKLIGERAFEACSSLTAVNIPASVNSIGKNAFLGCTAVAEFRVASGNSLYSSVDGVLYGPFESPNDPEISNPVTDKALIQYPAAKAATDVTVAAGTLIIANDAFIGNEHIEKVTLPSGIKTIGDFAFNKCEKLAQINIPSSVEAIGSRAFAECPQLKTLTFFGNVGDFAFADSGLTSIVISSGAETIGIRSFENCKALKSADIPESVEAIGLGAFNGCTGLVNVKIGNGVISIGERAFSGCESLTGVTIPDSVTSIGVSAFDGCTGLTSITIGNGVTSIGNYAFYNTGKYNDSSNWENDVLYIGKYLIKAKTTISGNCDIKAGTKVLADFAFYNCTDLTGATISDSVTNIGISAFEGCTGMKKVTIGNGVTSIGNRAFFGCESLTSVTIPDSVTSIGVSAFNGCTELAKVTIGNGVTVIGNRAFNGCSKLTSVTIGNSVRNIGGYAFYDTGIYNDSSNWKNNVLYIGAYLISANTTISGNYDIKVGTKAMADLAFYNCINLTSVSIPDSVTNISISAFENCIRLTGVSIGNGATFIGDRAFFNCTKLISITIPNNITSIGSYVFENCTELTLIVDSGSAAQSYAETNGIRYRLRNQPAEKTIESIAVRTLPNKTSYIYKESLDTTGLTLTVNYTDGSSETVTDGFKASPDKFNSVGSKTVTVTYKNHTAQFGVKVSYAWWQWVIRILLLGFLWY